MRSEEQLKRFLSRRTRSVRMRRIVAIAEHASDGSYTNAQRLIPALNGVSEATWRLVMTSAMIAVAEANLCPPDDRWTGRRWDIVWNKLRDQVTSSTLRDLHERAYVYEVKRRDDNRQWEKLAAVLLGGWVMKQCLGRQELAAGDDVAEWSLGNVVAQCGLGLANEDREPGLIARLDAEQESEG
jgi:hypothetical protein